MDLPVQSEEYEEEDEEEEDEKEEEEEHRKKKHRKQGGHDTHDCVLSVRANEGRGEGARKDNKLTRRHKKRSAEDQTARSGAEFCSLQIERQDQ